jgi:hypothetical protein
MTSTRQTIEAQPYAVFLTPFERWHNLPYVGGWAVHEAFQRSIILVSAVSPRQGMTHVAATSIRARGGGIGGFVENSGIAAMPAPSNPSNPVGFSPPPQGLLTLCFSGRASLRRANCHQFPRLPCRTLLRRQRHSSWRQSLLPFPGWRAVSSPLRLASRQSARVVRASAAVVCSGAGRSRVLRGVARPQAHPQPARLLMLPITAVDSLPAGNLATSRINSPALGRSIARLGTTGLGELPIPQCPVGSTKTRPKLRLT